MDEERVNDALDVLTSAQIGDAKTERFVEHLGVRNFDLCVVAIGDDFQGSLETTSLLKRVRRQICPCTGEQGTFMQKFPFEKRGPTGLFMPKGKWPKGLP